MAEGTKAGLGGKFPHHLPSGREPVTTTAGTQGKPACQSNWRLPQNASGRHPSGQPSRARQRESSVPFARSAARLHTPDDSVGLWSVCTKDSKPDPLVDRPLPPAPRSLSVSRAAQGSVPDDRGYKVSPSAHTTPTRSGKIVLVIHTLPSPWPIVVVAHGCLLQIVPPASTTGHSSEDGPHTGHRPPTSISLTNRAPLNQDRRRGEAPLSHQRQCDCTPRK